MADNSGKLDHYIKKLLGMPESDTNLSSDALESLLQCNPMIKAAVKRREHQRVTSVANKTNTRRAKNVKQSNGKTVHIAEKDSLNNFEKPHEADSAVTEDIMNAASSHAVSGFAGPRTPQTPATLTPAPKEVEILPDRCPSNITPVSPLPIKDTAVGSAGDLEKELHGVQVALDLARADLERREIEISKLHIKNEQLKKLFAYIGEYRVGKSNFNLPWFAGTLGAIDLYIDKWQGLAAHHPDQPKIYEEIHNLAHKIAHHLDKVHEINETAGGGGEGAE